MLLEKTNNDFFYRGKDGHCWEISTPKHVLTKLRRLGITNQIAMSNSNQDSYIVGRFQTLQYPQSIKHVDLRPLAIR